MSSSSANFCDLTQAKQLSRRLALGQPERQEEPKPAPQPVTYVAFRAEIAPSAPAMAPVDAPAAAAVPASPAREESLPPPPATIRNWDDMLAWCQEVSFAKMVFVMDSQGFVIAKDGSYSYEDAEAMGTQIMVALDRFDELDTFNKRALSVTVEFRSFWLTGIRVPAESRDCFTLGLLRTDSPPARVVQEISREVSARASEL